MIQLTCKRHKYVIRESKECWDKVPVEPIGFLDAVTKVYSQHATKAPCSSTYPLTVHVGEGWVKLTPPLKTPEHLMMQPLDPFSSGACTANKS